MKNTEIFGLLNALNSREAVELKGVKYAYRRAKIVKQLREHAEALQEGIKHLFDATGKPKEGYKETKEWKEYEQLLQQEADPLNIQKFHVSDLPENISAGLYEALQLIIEDDEQ